MAGIAVLDTMQKALAALPMVKGIITVQNSTSLPVRTTVTGNVAAVIAHHIMKIIPTAKSLLAEVDPHDSLQFFRIRGKNFEYLVVLDKDYTMIGIQEHTVLETTGEGGQEAASAALKMVTEPVETANTNRAAHANRNHGHDKHHDEHAKEWWKGHQ